MKTSETERTPGPGLQPYLSGGIFSARSTSRLPTNSISERQSPRNPGSGGVGCVWAARTEENRHARADTIASFFLDPPFSNEIRGEAVPTHVITGLCSCCRRG